MDVQASMLDMPKKCRTNIGVLNVVLRNEEDYSAILEQHRKKRIDHARPSTVVVATFISSVVNSPFVAHASSPIFVHGKVEKLFEEVIVERAEKESMNVTMKKMAEKHKATIRKMAEEKKATMASLDQRHTKALEYFKKETFQNFNNFLPNLSVLCYVASDQLGFDVHFPSRAP
ncbi:hypothetical protein PVK06_027507 [Gossypium arboreum]|uniref:Uncharacterized protein n=1 Tax=Gossypium arboreum TaxID=29729 RepID=A0ABR0P0G6_GOSAR|nr:hypothetical protein PVK06_027507 [Gossypium arboreum]